MADQEANLVYRIVVFSFEGQKRAGEVVELAKRQQSAGDYKVAGWAVVEVDEKGKSHTSGSGHGGLGAGVGMGAGALLGLIGGPAGLLLWTLGGAAIGGVLGKKTGHIVPDDELKAIAATMQPNSSAVIAVVQDLAAEQLADSMGKQGAKVVTVTLGDQVSGELVNYAAVDLGDPGEIEAGDDTAKTEEK